MFRPPLTRRESANSQRSCLKSGHSVDDHSPPSGVMTPGGSRKCVAFCSDELEQIFVADEWDRTPTEIAQKLSYGDVLELKAIQRSLPMAHQPKDPFSNRPHSQTLKNVPIGLLPLMSDTETYSKPASTPTSFLEDLPELPSRPSSSARNSPTPTPTSIHFNLGQWVPLLPVVVNSPKSSPPTTPPSEPVSPTVASPIPVLPGAARSKPQFNFVPLLDPVSVEPPIIKVNEAILPPASPTSTDDPGLTTDESDSHDDFHDDSSHDDDSGVTRSRSLTPSPTEPSVIPDLTHSPFKSQLAKPREPSNLRTDCTPSLLGATKEEEPSSCEFVFNYDDDADLEPSISRRSPTSFTGGRGPQYDRRSNGYSYSPRGYNPVLARSRR